MTNPSPTEELREQIWQHIKGWDIQRSLGEGYAHATGTDVDGLMSLFHKALEAREKETRIDELKLFVNSIMDAANNVRPNLLLNEILNLESRRATELSTTPHTNKATEEK